eukprot:354869-Chlamydomonas_euryale.AAC.7
MWDGSAAGTCCALHMQVAWLVWQCRLPRGAPGGLRGGDSPGARPAPRFCVGVRKMWVTLADRGASAVPCTQVHCRTSRHSTDATGGRTLYFTLRGP